MSKSQEESDGLDQAINQLALDLESAIKKSEKALAEAPAFEDRRKKNTVQLRKVLDGDIDGLVTGDE